MTPLGRAVLGLALAAVLLAAPAGVAPPLTPQVSVAGNAPVVTGVSAPASVNPTSGGTVQVSISVGVSDKNGANDITAVKGTLHKPDGSVHTQDQSGQKVSGTGKAATFGVSFTLNYYDPAGLYTVSASAVDKKGLSDSSDAPSNFTYNALAALGLGSATVDLGSDLAPGDAGDIASLAILNKGNVRIDVQVEGTDLAHESEDASLPVEAVAYSAASDMDGSAALDAEGATLGSFNLATGAASSKPLYWQLGVPTGEEQWVPSGTYAGTLTVTAVEG